MDNICPYDVYTQLKNDTPVPKKIFEGSYTLWRDEVVVEIQTHYCILNFRLQMRDADDRYTGKYNVLRILEHSSRGLGESNENDYFFKLPSNTDMLFYRHWDWE